jgi:2-keto-4-pentenoate hydratase/2-oxohepta-3-ene-1,7-dioic acid hydratase in catechol pathway
MTTPSFSPEAEERQGRIRVVRAMTPGGPRWGILEDDVVYRLPADPFGAWEPAISEDRAVLGRHGELALLAPATPTKIVCVGRNYPAHAAEHGAVVPEEPLIFFKPPSAIIGPDAAIHLPSQSERVDYEAELVVVIGRRCRNVVPEEAWDCVFGVTCGNDVTARDLQRLDDQWIRAKGFDTFCPLGPWLVTGLSEHDVAQLEIICRVNGEARQGARASEMAFSPAELIAYTSSIMTLEPGDVIMTGTPEGVGALSPQDEVEVQIEGVGRLRNVVAGGDCGSVRAG